MMRVGIVVFALGLMWLSQIESIAQFYFAFVLIAIGSSFAGFFPLTVAVCNWFERYRARALAMNNLGLALGGLAVPLVAWSMQSFGWRQTAFVSGLLILVVGLPLVNMIRRRPEDYGDVVDGIRAAPAPAQRAEQPAPASTRLDFTARQALATRAFWLISCGHAAALLVVSAVNVHAITHMRESVGYSIAQAALVMSAQTAAQVCGIVVSMLIGDRFDKRLMSAACMLSHMVGVLVLAYATSLTMLLAFAVLHGGAWGLRGPFMSAIRADYFGRASFGVIMGVSQVIVVIGSLAGPLLAGALADATGNYRLGFTVLAFLGGLGSVFFYFGRRPMHPGEASKEIGSGGAGIK
jgi:MFS family permease